MGILGNFNIGNLGNITSIFGNGSGGNAAGVIQEGLSLLAGGEGDSSIISKLGQSLGEMKSNINTKLDNFKNSETYSNLSSSILTMAEKIDEAGIPDKIQKTYQDFRHQFMTSGVVGKIASGALSLMYGVGKMMPSPIKETVAAMESVVTPDAVGTIINKSLGHIEKNFFQQIENSESYKGLRKEVLDVVSAENIVRVSQHLFDTSLDVGLAVTKEGGSIQDVQAAITEHVENFKADQEIEHLNEAAPYVLPTLGEVVKGTVNSGVAIASDKDIQGHVSAGLQAAPGAAMSAGSAWMNAFQSIAGMFGGLGLK